MNSKYSIVNADFLQWLDTYNPDKNGYFHALLADPPYALLENSARFSDPDAAAPDESYAGGAFTRQARGFMGQTWDGFRDLRHYQEWVTSWAVKLPRVMFPGATVALFGGSRTWHRMAVGLEDAGLEIFDVLMWVYGSGMPKSHNIGRGFERAAGVEMKKQRRLKKDGTEGVSFRSGESVAHGDYGDKDLTYERQLYTPEGQRWAGHGTLLKPAYEPLILARIPRGKLSFVQLARQFQTGALNLDGARVPVAGNPESGRFPSNVVLSHLPTCQYRGLKSVSIHSPGEINSAPHERYGVYGSTGGRTDTRKQNEDGAELIEVWECGDGCPVHQLNEQSGFSVSEAQTSRKASGSRSMAFAFGENYNSPSYSDGGGAARFFYTGKAATWERFLPSYRQPIRIFEKGKRAEMLARMAELGREPLFGSKDIFHKDDIPMSLRHDFEPARATHPTVKPLDITSYLATLLLPPANGERVIICPVCRGSGYGPEALDTESKCPECLGAGRVRHEYTPEPRRLLIPFSGVGSEMIGAVLAGWDFVQGVELTPDYIPQALDRLQWWSQYPSYQIAQTAYNQRKKPRLQVNKAREKEEQAGVKRLELFPDDKF